MRKEHDPLGYKEVPSNAYYGIHTQRAKENFKISGLNTPTYFYHAIAQIKLSAIRVNAKSLGKKAKPLIKASKEFLSGQFDGHLPLDYLQAGMGTPMNMNVNEILANRANEILNCGKGHYECVHPNDDVNMGQSTNNVIPTALKIAALERLKEFQKELDLLIKAFDKKGKEFSSIKKTGRTHLQDAVPITLGKEFDSYSYALSNSKARVLQASQELLIVGIGGNAIGTAINTPKNYDKNIVKYLRAQTKLDLKVTKDHVGMTSFPHEFLNVSNSLNLIATDLIKICNDLRLLSSGPTAGFNEINLPAVEPGSSIMPGKLNPSVPECVNMICFDVIGNTQSILMASQAGQLQLNVMMPLIIYKLLFSIDILTNGFKTLRTRCIDGITANKEICESYFEKSNGLATLLNPVIGYDTAAKVAQKAIKQDKTIKQLVLEEKILSKKQWDELVKKTV